jgi:hypothetical protein
MKGAARNSSGERVTFWSLLPKHQTPNTKLQQTSKYQTPNAAGDLAVRTTLHVLGRFGVCGLRVRWCLVFGVWHFPPSVI